MVNLAITGIVSYKETAQIWHRFDVL